MGRRKGAKSIRIKKAIVEILKNYPDGLAVPEISDKLQNQKVSAWNCPSGVQLGQILRGTLGVTQDGFKMLYAGETQVKYVNWVLTDLAKFEAWCERRID